MTFHVFTGVLPMVGGKAEKEDEEMANQSKLRTRTVQELWHDGNPSAGFWVQGL